jgi:hypothetical protein
LTQPQPNRLHWLPIIDRAREIVLASALAMTLRMLLYSLVSEELIPNAAYPYKRLSALTAEGRREGTFPALIDPTREIYRPLSFAGLDDLAEWVESAYRLDRTEGQSHQIVLGVEKATQVASLQTWFRDLGVPIVALRGYTSQSHVDEVSELIKADPRPSVLVYAGDFDPSGVDILRDFRRRGADRFDRIEQVALSWEQVEEHDLPPRLGKATDSRARAFAARHGRLVQVELEALPPAVLRDLYQQVIDQFLDKSAFADLLADERTQRAEATARLNGGRD